MQAEICLNWPDGTKDTVHLPSTEDPAELAEYVRVCAGQLFGAGHGQ
jgi:hypothetical protein